MDWDLSSTDETTQVPHGLQPHDTLPREPAGRTERAAWDFVSGKRNGSCSPLPTCTFQR